MFLCSGYAAENIDKVLRGLRVGTLFHQDARLWAPITDSTARDMAVAARENSRKLQALSSEDRKQILYAIADALEANEKTIRAENELDVATAQEAGLEESLVARLVMTPAKVSLYSWSPLFMTSLCFLMLPCFVLDRSRALQIQFVS